MKLYEVKKDIVEKEIYKRKKARLCILANELKKIKSNKIPYKNIDIVFDDFLRFKKSKGFDYVRESDESLMFLEDIYSLDSNLYNQEVNRINNLLKLIQKELINLEKGRF